MQLWFAGLRRVVKYIDLDKYKIKLKADEKNVNK